MRALARAFPPFETRRETSHLESHSAPAMNASVLEVQIWCLTDASARHSFNHFGSFFFIYLPAFSSSTSNSAPQVATRYNVSPESPPRRFRRKRKNPTASAGPFVFREVEMKDNHRPRPNTPCAHRTPAPCLKKSRAARRSNWLGLVERDAGSYRRVSEALVERGQGNPTTKRKLEVRGVVA